MDYLLTASKLDDFPCYYLFAIRYIIFHMKTSNFKQNQQEFQNRVVQNLSKYFGI